MESCSMWLDNRVTVRLLFKCPSFSSRHRLRRNAVKSQTIRTVTRTARNAHSPEFQNFTGSRHLRSPDIRTRRLRRSKNGHASLPVDQSGMNYSSPMRSVGRLNTRNSASIFLDRFTLLIDEFSWVNGNPRFAMDRPVYFMGKQWPEEIMWRKIMQIYLADGSVNDLLSGSLIFEIGDNNRQRI